MDAQAYWALSPVIGMALLALVLLSADAILDETMFGGRRWGSKRALSWIAVIGLLAPAFLTLNLWFEWFGDIASGPVVYGTFVADRFALFFQFIIVGATAVVLLASVPYLGQFRDSLGEFYALLLTASAGMMLLVGADELITIYVRARDYGTAGHRARGDATRWLCRRGWREVLNLVGIIDRDFALRTRLPIRVSRERRVWMKSLHDLPNCRWNQEFRSDP